jgi:uncharacterized membrane protein YkvA (DUF1232 family)
LKINPRVLQWVRRLKRNLLALWFAYRHPDTPFPAKVLAVLVAGYAFSPIDLIPDFLPLVGYLDEFILLPGAIYLAFRLIPKPVLEECQGRADRFLHEHRHTPRNYVAAFVIVLLWAAGLWWLWTVFGDAVVGWIRDALE